MRSVLVLLVGACTVETTTGHGAEDSGPGPDARTTDAPAPTDAGADADVRDAPGPDALERVTAGLVARWDFDENGGMVVADRSGVDPALDLTISEAGAGVTWLAGALRVDADSVLTTAGPATKVIDAVLASNELTVEAWVVPANLTQAGPARILTCSQNTSLRNFQVAQEAAVFNGRFRTTTTGLNGGIPELEGGTVVLALTQVTMTRNAAGERRLYVNGVQVAMDAVGGGLSTWDPSFAIAVANEHTRDRDWLGELHLIAIYGRALSGAELQQNFSVGP